MFSKVEARSPSTPLALPCGQCRGCRLERSRTWALRCVHEASLHDQNSFITLTYSPEELPKDGSLNVKHWQDFAKRLRKNIDSFRFYMCGEYGEAYNRPHYHALIFGLDFSRDRKFWKSTEYGNLYTSRELEETWGKGFCTIGNVDFRSAAYVARYVMKKQSPKKAFETGRYTRYEVCRETGEILDQWNVIPEFATMSRRPGIGKAWYDKNKKECYPSDFCVNDGKKIRVPRYYDNQLEEEDPDLLDRMKVRRLRAAKRQAKENTWERLRVRERVAERRASEYERNVC